MGRTTRSAARRSCSGVIDRAVPGPRGADLPHGTVRSILSARQPSVPRPERPLTVPAGTGSAKLDGKEIGGPGTMASADPVTFLSGRAVGQASDPGGYLVLQVVPQPRPHLGVVGVPVGRDGVADGGGENLVLLAGDGQGAAVLAGEVPAVGNFSGHRIAPWSVGRVVTGSGSLRAGGPRGGGTCPVSYTHLRA